MENINDAWKSTCKLILGDEIGDLQNYRNYLLKHIEPPQKGASTLSGEGVALTPGLYATGSKFIGNNEREQYSAWLTKENLLTINELKDFDSLREALADKLYYSGNIILGKSSDITESTDCVDSHGIHCSWMIREGSKFVAFSSKLRVSEYAFGSCDGGEDNRIIKAYNAYRNTRCFEALRSKPVSDCYYVSNLQGCGNCMFSFNLRSKNYVIGNLQLAKDQYAKISRKLIADIRDTLKSKKTVPSIIELIVESRKKELQPLTKEEIVSVNRKTQEPISLEPIEKAFQKTTELVLGKPVSKINDYAKWLEEYSVEIEKTKSCVSEAEVVVPNLEFYKSLRNYAVKEDESLILGKRSVNVSKLEELSLENAAGILCNIATFMPEVIFDTNLNIIDCVDYQSANDAYMSSLVFFSRIIGFSHFARTSENLFGTYAMLNSRFCIRCRNSTYLTRCFEVIDSNKCSDCYFCHNCENVNESMFCFNAKNLRYAVGNVEIGKEKYIKIKEKMLSNINLELEQNKALKLSVYKLNRTKKE